MATYPPAYNPTDVARIYADALHELFRVASNVDSAGLGYDGDRTVTAGPVMVCFTPRQVEVSFTDPYSGLAERVTLAITGAYSLGALAAVVEGLLIQLAVTP